MLVVGDREQQSGQVAVRNRKHGDQGVKSVDDFLDRDPEADRGQDAVRVAVALTAVLLAVVAGSIVYSAS